MGMGQNPGFCRIFRGAKSKISQYRSKIMVIPLRSISNLLSDIEVLEGKENGSYWYSATGITHMENGKMVRDAESGGERAWAEARVKELRKIRA